jgi:hypothetical protein
MRKIESVDPRIELEKIHWNPVRVITDIRDCWDNIHVPERESEQ